MRDKLNCPNCGAPIRGVECEYCGTMFYDFASIDLDRPTYMRVKGPHGLAIFRAQVRDWSFEAGCDQTFFYADDTVYTAYSPSYSCRLEFDILPDDKGKMLEVRR